MCIYLNFSFYDSFMEVLRYIFLQKGIVINNVFGVVKEVKQGLFDFRMKDVIVYVGFGKVYLYLVIYDYVFFNVIMDVQ